MNRLFAALLLAAQLGALAGPALASAMPAEPAPPCEHAAPPAVAPLTTLAAVSVPTGCCGACQELGCGSMAGCATLSVALVPRLSVALAPALVTLGDAERADSHTSFAASLKAPPPRA
jgi:hypothetical protein